MHSNSTTHTFLSLPKLTASALIVSALCAIAFTPSLAIAKKYSQAPREDTVISTGSSEITITDDPLSGDRILEVKPETQEEENCNKYTDGQYPIIIELKPDISNYKK
ncbi:hypothetical protein [Halodesulfovibrio sp.]|jgi:hypothetical protein|uniref:hypothetical protein n=1 Tax=Halodesulfovibrio sp. TaxID=1912772 RepID=UPI0025F1D852|nr:hypothetical protein [Halodesulfovibrio sp.]MCT4627545.1 hypothetical protein [Halodesulfovibrio sp.]